MAGPTPLQGDRASWCRERLDFFCAVINDVNRESLKAELEACETEEEAAGLMHSLLWLQDNMRTQHPGGAAAADPSAPDMDVFTEDEAFPGEIPPVVVEAEDPIYQPFRQDETHQGLAATREPYVVVHVRPDRQPSHPGDNQPLYPRDHNHQSQMEHQSIYYQQPQQQQQEEEEKEEEANATEDYQDLLPQAEGECHMLQDAPHLDDHDQQPEQEERHQCQGLQQQHEQQQPQQQQQQQQNQQQEEVEKEEGNLVDIELLPPLPPRNDTPEPALVHNHAGDHGIHEPLRTQERHEDHSADDPSDSEDHDQFEDILEDQESEAEAAPLPADQQDVPMAADVGESNSGVEDMEPIDPTSEKSDPYYDADEPSADDFVDVDEGSLEDDLVMPTAVQGRDEETVVVGLEVNGAVGGGGLEDEEEKDDTMDDERFAKELSDAINAEELARMEDDERLAKELSEEMEREERQREEEDEELARRLAEEMEDEETENQNQQRQDNNPPVEIIFAEAEDNQPPPAALHMEALEDVEGDEEMARQLEAEAAAQMREEQKEDEEAGRVAALINMFPDADPTYLVERMDGVESEEAFRQVVEALLQCQKTEPRMKGYQKLLKQNQAARHDQEPAQATALASTASVAPSFIAASGQVFECTICFEEEVPAKDMASCNALYKYHEFCIECIRKHVAALIGQGHSVFRCMNGYCEAEFSWRTLRRVMEPVVYRKVQERRQQEEVMAAGVDNLVSCPFCCFMIIMPDPENKVLECLNPECLKESCRMCKEPSHIPLRCEEVERDSQKDARTMLENKMAEAMIRQCPKCGKRFVTEGGCNKMTCTCGTVMCYLCKKVITDGYNHFEQRGGVASSKCPLWSNASEVHVGEVRQAAAAGRQELEPGMMLVHDPTRDVL